MTDRFAKLRGCLRSVALGCGVVLAVSALDCLMAAGGLRPLLVSAALADDDAVGGPGDRGADVGGPGTGADGIGADRRGGPPRSGDRGKFTWPWERWFSKKPDPPSPGPPPLTAMPREVVVAGIDADAARRLVGEGFAIVAERPFGLPPTLVLRLRVPNGMPMLRAMARARALAPGAAVDRNHLFANGYVVQTGAQAVRQAFAEPLTAVAWPMDQTCRFEIAIGIVDTGVDPEHPALLGKPILRETVRGPNLAPSSLEHGTTVATLLLGDRQFAGLVPNARLVAVDAFHRRDGRDRADTFDVVSAIDLLVARKVTAINLSLAGPANEVLDRAGQAALAKNVLIVAAAGNEGPTAPPLYPAAYRWAVAVTAIDTNRVAYGRAGRGPHLGFAAPGVRLALADRSGRVRMHSGTSFAAPFVTAALAQARGAHPEIGTADLLAAFSGRAVDLGTPGRDAVFGWGLLNLANRCTINTERE